MEDKAELISERFLDYGAEIVKLAFKLNRTAPERHIAGQLLRCGTSAGANYEEARGAQSRADFIHKLQVVLKEIREALYWLKLIEKCNLQKKESLAPIIEETVQLNNIIAKSVLTAKAKR